MCDLRTFNKHLGVKLTGAPTALKGKEKIRIYFVVRRALHFKNFFAFIGPNVWRLKIEFGRCSTLQPT